MELPKICNSNHQIWWTVVVPRFQSGWKKKQTGEEKMLIVISSWFYFFSRKNKLNVVLLHNLLIIMLWRNKLSIRRERGNGFRLPAAKWNLFGICTSNDLRVNNNQQQPANQPDPDKGEKKEGEEEEKILRNLPSSLKRWHSQWIIC